MQPGDEQDPIARELDALPQIEPPADLRRAIMEAIRQCHPEHSEGPVRAGGTIGVPPISRVPRYARDDRKTLLIPAAIWASAAAIIIAFVLYTRTASDHATATMAPIQTPKTTLTIEREGDFIRLEPILRRAGSISIRWDPKTADFVAFRGGSNASSGNDHIAFHLRGPTDRAAIILRPHRDAAGIDVRVAVDGQEVIRTNIPLR